MAAPRPIALAVAFGVAALVAGCTSGGTGSGSAATSTTTGPPAGAATVQLGYENVVSEVLPSVVQINTASGLGSGVVYDDKGDIVTNAHVVGDATTFQVLPATQGQQLDATLVATYPPSDLAVIKVANASALRPATFGSSAALRVGQLVLAMGSPLGLSASVTNGIVSATGRTVDEPASGGGTGATITDAIQTSAPINPGNSGGALVDLSGHVIGIPTLAAVDPNLGNAAAGIGFAIPSATVTDLANQMIKSGTVTNSGRAALNITARTVVDGNGNPAGVGVASVTPGGAADKAGIVAGDVITALNGTPTPTVTALNHVLAGLKPGARATVSLRRAAGGTANVQVTLGQLGG